MGDFKSAKPSSIAVRYRVFQEGVILYHLEWVSFRYLSHVTSADAYPYGMIDVITWAFWLLSSSHVL